MIRRGGIALAIVVALAMASCGERAATRRPTLAVSIEPQRALLEAIVDTLYQVVTVIPPGSNPESFEPSMSQRVALERADAYFAVGTLPLEENMRRALDNTPIYDTAQGVAMIEEHEHGGHAHTDAEGHTHHHDPHVWSSVKNARIMASNMATAMTQIDPEHAQEYMARWRALDARLDSVDRKLRARLHHGSTFIVWHPSLGYFARDYGLQQMAIGQENKETSPMQMRQAIDAARATGAPTFFFQREFDTRQAQSAAEEIGARLIVIDPLAYDLTAQLDTLAKYIQQ